MKGGFKNISMKRVRYEKATDRSSCVLPDDLIVCEILHRLPVKSLLRFESVSKSWQYVIRSSKFIAKHAIHHQEHNKKKAEFNYLHLYRHVAAGCNNNYGPFSLCYCPPPTSGLAGTSPGIKLISKREEGKVITSAVSHSPLNFDIQSVSIVGSSNGLVCIKFCYLNTANTDDFACWERCFGIWNPATRKFKLLPTPQPAPVVRDVCNIIVGFSYIPSASSYKLVEIWVFKAHDEANNVRFGARVKVLNIGENSWREVVCQNQDEEIHELGWRFWFLESSMCYIHNHPVVAKGCLHWLGTLQHGEVILVSFDLDKEVYTQAALPYPFEDHVNLMSMGCRLSVFEDNLTMFVSPSPNYMLDGIKDKEFYFEVWVYEGTSKSWTKRFSFGPLPGNEHPVGFLGKGDIIIRKKSPYPWGSMPYLYNISNREKKRFPCSEINCNLAFEPYSESLVEI